MAAEALRATTTSPSEKDSKQVLRDSTARELIFAVVGPVGSGTSTVATQLCAALSADRPGGPFQVKLIKAAEVIEGWAEKNGNSLLNKERKDIDRVVALQNLGDEMRKSDHAAVAKGLVGRIRALRAEQMGRTLVAKEPVTPDRERRAYVIDALRHPEEVHLLRNVYQIAFAMIGVVCDEGERKRRLGEEKFGNAGKDHVKALMKRDAKAPEKHGQRVEDTFELSDFFVDNSVKKWLDDDKQQLNPHWHVPDQLNRLIKIVTHASIVRPTTAETAMYAASGAQRRSACLSRQVGASLVDKEGNLIAVGTNEVPRAGGGVYGQGFSETDADLPDERCAYRSRVDKRYCSNTHEQQEIVGDLIKLVEDQLGKEAISPANRQALMEKFRRSQVGALIEFSRAVHAEMDALLAAARKGVPLAGTRMFVTTYPCHSCARHLVAAGIDEVQFVEAYQKSKAKDLHDDSITSSVTDWSPPSRGGKKVLFRPFTGVAPRLYARAFLKDRDLKEPGTGHLKVFEPHWGGPWEVSRVSYAQIEADLEAEAQS